MYPIFCWNLFWKCYKWHFLQACFEPGLEYSTSFCINIDWCTHFRLKIILKMLQVAFFTSLVWSNLGIQCINPTYIHELSMPSLGCLREVAEIWYNLSKQKWRTNPRYFTRGRQKSSKLITIRGQKHDTNFQNSF